MNALAVNTIVNNAGKLYGYNSDAIGIKTALIKSIKTAVLNIKTAVIYGNGGVSGVAFHVLLESRYKSDYGGQRSCTRIGKEKIIKYRKCRPFRRAL